MTAQWCIPAEICHLRSWTNIKTDRNLNSKFTIQIFHPSAQKGRKPHNFECQFITKIWKWLHRKIGSYRWDITWKKSCYDISKLTCMVIWWFLLYQLGTTTTFKRMGCSRDNVPQCCKWIVISILVKMRIVIRWWWFYADNNTIDND